jgi:hypothetical protein
VGDYPKKHSAGQKLLIDLGFGLLGGLIIGAIFWVLHVSGS